MNLAKRDKTIDFLKLQIEERKKMLFDKYKYFRQVTNQNEYIKGVLYDYQNYYQYIQKQKKQQIESYESIYNYLDNIIRQNNNTMQEINNALKEQNEILNKINNIKKELDDIILDK